jgi:hypothetical protein
LYEYTEFETKLVLYLLRTHEKKDVRLLKRDLMKFPDRGYKKIEALIRAYCK